MAGERSLAVALAALAVTITAAASSARPHDDALATGSAGTVPQRFVPRGAVPGTFEAGPSPVRVTFLIRRRSAIFTKAYQKRYATAPAPGPAERFVLRHAPRTYVTRYARFEA